VIAALAVIAGIGAYISLWQTGDKGWGKATSGMVFGLICLSPLIYGAVQFVRYPALNDVTTDVASPLLLLSKPGMSTRRTLAQPEILAAFPNLFTRTYQLEAGAVFTVVQRLIAEREWDIRVRRQPGANTNPGQINAMAMTIFGWRDEVVVRVRPGSDGTRVDMRSASLFGLSDLGVNGTRIESFLLDLDTAVTKALLVPENSVEEVDH